MNRTRVQVTEATYMSSYKMVQMKSAPEKENGEEEGTW
jgi:hypothetical protein